MRQLNMAFGIILHTTSMKKSEKIKGKEAVATRKKSRSGRES
jgi:hypothetical protein